MSESLDTRPGPSPARSPSRAAHPDDTSVLPAKYLNRLSDLLFILSRVANPDGDVLWHPGGPAQ